MRLTKLESGPEIIVIRCEGLIVQSEFEPGSDPLERCIGPGCWTRKVILNLETTSYIDSSGIGWLIHCHKLFSQVGGRMVLYSVPPMVDQVLQILKLPLFLNIAPNEAAARTLALGEKK